MVRPGRQARDAAGQPAGARDAAGTLGAGGRPGDGAGNGFQRAPDEAENDGMAPQAPKPNRPAKKSRNKRHGRPR